MGGQVKLWLWLLVNPEKQLFVVVRNDLLVADFRDNVANVLNCLIYIYSFFESFLFTFLGLYLELDLVIEL